MGIISILFTNVFLKLNLPGNIFQKQFIWEVKDENALSVVSDLYCI